MFKIKDRILLGSISGILSAAVVRIINEFNYEKGLTDIRYNPMAAELFLERQALSSNRSFTGASLLWNIMCNINNTTWRQKSFSTQSSKVFKKNATDTYRDGPSCKANRRELTKRM